MRAVVVSRGVCAKDTELESLASSANSEGSPVRTKSETRAAKQPKASRSAAPAKPVTTSAEVVERGLRARIAKLDEQAHGYQAALDAVAQGVCAFDADERLIASNRRFAEIYHLAPNDIAPGATLREIVELRVAAGTCATTADFYLTYSKSNRSRDQARTWTTEFKDGRTVRIHHLPTREGGWVSTHEDVTEIKSTLVAANERLSLQALIDQLPDNLWVKDVNSRFLIANHVTAERIGAAGPADLIGKTDLELLPPEIANKFYADEQEIVRSGEPMVDMEEYVFDSSGGRTWILTTKVPLRNERNEIFGVAGISRDATERKLADALREGQAQILEMIATSAPLGAVLEHLIHLLESQFKGMLGSVLLLEETGKRLRHGAAPSLPDTYTKAIDGLRIGPKAGSCGTAAYRRETVVVADIMTDPLWVDYKDLAAEHGLRSCWSAPILSHEGAILGAFAMYSKEVHEPSDAELRLVDLAIRIAGIAIERKAAEDRIASIAKRAAGRSKAVKD
jgi:PAS domain S-box-containing protein